MSKIKRVSGLEILDSRGRPTVEATVLLQGGPAGTASVPSGASRGQAEAFELRDGDLARYQGLGCRNAVANINQIIHRSLANRAFETQADLDRALIETDGTKNKSKLGANATLAVSLAYSRATARELNLPLYAYYADLVGHDPASLRLPRPMINLFSGGKHAGMQVPVQDVLVMPMSPASIDGMLAMAFDMYQQAANLLTRKYGMRLLTADEGGLAPAFAHVEAMFEDAMEVIRHAELVVGKDVALAVDIAASHFYQDGSYWVDGEAHDSSQMIELITNWVADYSIVSVEDGLAEDDWGAWPALVSEIGSHALVLGDDFLCTNPGRIMRAVEAKAATALLLKINQIGTLSEAVDALRIAREAGWSVVASARSGETEDHWLADLAVGWGADYIKVGSITQSERLAKYNRLLAIEAAHSFSLMD